VRSIFLELEQRRLLDRTWVLIVADHGEAFGESGFVTHWLSDAGDREATFHVPMVWAPPPSFAGAVTVNEEVSLADVAPTIYDLAGIDWTTLKARAPAAFGASLVSQLVGASARSSTPAVVGPDMSDTARRQMRQAALDRLRALGYLR
jgi:arylsulfatase A-like enzyme